MYQAFITCLQLDTMGENPGDVFAVLRGWGGALENGADLKASWVALAASDILETTFSSSEYGSE